MGYSIGNGVSSTLLCITHREKRADGDDSVISNQLYESGGAAFGG